jgi:hypothetical protein
MLLGLAVTFVMLCVITVLGVLGYLMDKLVEHDESDDRR